MAASTLIVADFTHRLRDNQWLVQNGHLPKAHAVIGDPPYFLGSIAKRFGGKNAVPAQFGRDGAFQRQSRGFMGKTWDGFEDVWEYQAWVTEWATLLLDYVYPGAVLALFGGTRTYHRLAAGLEDAGWEIFDSMMMIYASGFPKAADIGKLIDKAEGAEREILGFSPYSANRSADMGYHGGSPNEGARMLSAPASPDAQRFDGYKTALKPAYEPIVLARAPRGTTTYAELAQRYGTGGLNVDAGRIGTSSTPRKDPRNGNLTNAHMEMRPWMKQRIEAGLPLKGDFEGDEGRYPANLALVCACEGASHATDCPVRLLDEQGGERKACGNLSGQEPSAKTAGIYGGGFDRNHQWSSYADSGGASRFFYTAKAPAWEREAGLADFVPQTVTDGRDTPIDNAYQRGETQRRNIHPTVKPIRLIHWLASMLLPPTLKEPRRVLVPFAGSGSEMIGCALAGWDDVMGIERDPQYAAINEARRAWWGQFDSYEAAQATQKQERIDETDDEPEEIQLDIMSYLEALGAQP